MKTEKIVLKLLSIILIAVFAITTSSMNFTSIAKTTSVNLNLKIQYKRYSNETEGKAYAYNSTEGKHPFFQILEEDSGSSSKGYYCLNAIVSNTWNQQGTISAGQSVNYNNSYDMKTELEEIKTSQDPNYQKLAKSEHIQEIMWLLKNMYVPTGNKNTDDAQREALLSNAGIIYSDIEINDLESFYGSGQPTIEHAYKYVPQTEYDDYVTTRAAGLSESSQVKTGWYYFAKDTSEFTSVLLPDELIEVAEQAAIWYYANYLDDTLYEHREQFNVREKGLQLLCSEDGSGQYTSWQPLINQFQMETDADRVSANTGSWMQDQATILCWYLIDAAEKNATASSQEASEGVPLKVSVPVNGQNTSYMNINTVDNENYYVLGPIKVDKVLEESYTLSDTIKVNGKDCTEYKVLSNKTDTTSSNSTISDEIGKEVYLGIPLSWVKQNNASKETEQNDIELEITFSGTYKTNAITLYESSTNGEQPIAKVEPKNQPFELKVKAVDPKEADLALTKFITAVSNDATIEDGEYLTADKHVGSNTNPYLRATSVDTTNLKNDPTCHSATYNMVKTPLTVPAQSYVLYNIRVYNEGGTNVYAGEVKDHLPSYLEFVSGSEINTRYGWSLDTDGVTVKTNYLEYKAGQTTHLLNAFDKTGDNGAGSGLDYEDLQILCRVKETAPEETNIVNTAEVSKYQDETGSTLTEDVDSQPNNRQNKNTESREQDDDDWEVVKVGEEKPTVDLALTKFITAVSNDATIEDGEYLTADKHVGSNTNPYLRATSVDTTNLKNDPTCHDATYNMVKTPLTVPAQSYVLYNIRVYNEGEVDVYAGEVKDHLPEYLDYVYCDFNDNFGWKLAEDGKIISTKYLEYKENDETHLIKAFDKVRDDGAGSGLDYEDLQVLCRVNDKAPTNTEIVNVAEVSKYQDDEGKDITQDVDSTPNNLDTKNEDDDDFERVIVRTFDLSLLKWVSTVYVTEDGKTKTTQTGNTGDDSKDIIPKVEINRKKINSTVVRFGYTIKVTNQGDVEGYVKEITDYVPEGLKFYSEDNTGWTDEGNNVISTKLLENTLLKPGESAEVTVVLRWINGSNNLNLKTNIAEISEDYNEEGIPDRDSTPDNKKNGEDDIDDASVLLAVSTGSSMNLLKITLITTACLGTVIIFIVGFNVIRKYIL